MTDQFITSAREEISAADRALVAAFNRRLEIVRRLHTYKTASGMELRDPAREEAMLAELAADNSGPLSEAGLTHLHRFVLGLTRKELHGE